MSLPVQVITEQPMSDGRTRGWEDSSRGCQRGHDDQTFFCHKWLVSHCNVDGDGNDTVSDNERLESLSEQDRPEHLREEC